MSPTKSNSQKPSPPKPDRSPLILGLLILMGFGLYLVFYLLVKPNLDKESDSDQKKTGPVLSGPSESMPPNAKMIPSPPVNTNERADSLNSAAFPTNEAEAKAAKFDHRHKLWSVILGQYLVEKEGLSEFDYGALKKNKVLFNQYLQQLSAVPAVQFNLWTANQRLAFLINAYNAFTVSLVVEHYPIKTIKDISGLFSSPWKKKFFHLLGEKRHLDSLQFDLIMKSFANPKFHFSGNCASVSCPNLAPQAYRAKDLKQQLEQRTRAFINDKSRNTIDVPGRALKLSKIFKWYADDFKKRAKSIGAYVAPYITKDSKIKKDLSEGLYSIEYFDYDWTLNNPK